MAMKKFVHLRAKSLKEAGAAVSGAGRAIAIAGGTDALGALKDRIHKESPELVVDLKTIPGLSYISASGRGLRIGALTTLGEIAADNIMGGDRAFDDTIVPKCVYAWPEVGSVGLNKAQAEAKGLVVKTARAFYLGIGKAVATDETEGFAQLVFGEDDTVLGAQLVGGPATELIHVLALAVKLKLKKGDLRELIYAHPTMAEAIHEALHK